MLSKRLCKQCWVRAVKSSSLWKAWSQGREWLEKATWDDGERIACVICGQDSGRVGFHIPVDAEPPDECPFQLEHLMETQNVEP